ncbi:hypothetical protein D9611_000756 [Ephemerocybe angulata]|uniref:Uncharacterized protein n=2 Tax=Ephemerocybe angulata TaxID=980116 RepID=A0A8H6HPF9_9AGAR|nr:hypothetical protein D9611_000756 [Tulosesus angulatus]KAF6744628.1 hypothetical protein DFP72DRAFT_857326 [Tulosesus angulatus]KAF6749498.1 hypothetical protein DFP72DRAFT_1073034 [Tulosesus angulatus]
MPDKLGVALNAEELYRESAFEIHGRPKTTRNNINDYYVRDPPNNHELSPVPPKVRSGHGKFPEEAKEARRQSKPRAPKPREPEVLALGRKDRTQDLADVAVDNSVHG